MLSPGADPGHQRACSANSSSPCVHGFELCHGESMCFDKSDLQWCLNDNYRDRTYLSHCTRHIKSQLVYYEDVYDGQYHCLDRSDEDPFYNRRVKTGGKMLRSCNNATTTRPSWAAHGFWWTSQGYMTEDYKCISTVYWCNRDETSWMLSPEVSSPTTCENFTLWRDKPCGGQDFTRCFGHWSGECIPTGNTYSHHPAVCNKYLLSSYHQQFGFLHTIP